MRRWFPAVEVIADLSWGLTDTVVLHVRYAKGESMIKAGGPGNHHIGREIAAHEQWTTPWREAGRRTTTNPWGSCRPTATGSHATG